MSAPPRTRLLRRQPDVANDQLWSVAWGSPSPGPRSGDPARPDLEDEGDRDAGATPSVLRRGAGRVVCGSADETVSFHGVGWADGAPGAAQALRCAVVPLSRAPGHALGAVSVDACSAGADLGWPAEQDGVAGAVWPRDGDDAAPGPAHTGADVVVTASMDATLRAFAACPRTGVVRELGALPFAPMRLWETRLCPGGYRAVAAGGAGGDLIGVSLPTASAEALREAWRVDCCAAGAPRGDQAGAPDPSGLLGDGGTGGGLMAPPAGEPRFAVAVAVSPDGARAAVGLRCGQIAVVDLAADGGPRLLRRTPCHARPIRSLCFTADSRYLLSGSDDRYVHMSDADSGRVVEAFSGHQGWVLGVDTPGSSAAAVAAAGGAGGGGWGEWAASGGADGRVRIWDVGRRAREPVATLGDHGGHVWGCRWAPGGDAVASVADDGGICVHGVSAE